MVTASNRRCGFLVLSAIAAWLPGTAMAQAPHPARPVATGRSAYVGNRLLVRFAPAVGDREGQQRINQTGARPIGKFAKLGVHLAVLPPGIDARVAARKIARTPGVLFAEPDMLVRADAVPNDPQYANQWHLSKISGPAAWDRSTGSSSIVVAILDSGCDPSHPDLASKYVAGWNFYDNNSNTADVQGHGTAVAGTAASYANNGSGVASPAWNCKIMPVRISDTNGWAYWSTIATGLEWAADHGARVANISYNCTNSSVIQSAAQYFESKGGVVCVSAGNDSATVSDPDNPYVLTCSATDSNDNLASWSNRGTNVDVSAPGVNVLTTSRGGAYGYWSGTSFAAPTTAGVAALVLSANPGLSGAQAKQIVKDSTDDLGATGWDGNYGTGRVNAKKAVDLALSTSGADLTAPTVSLTAPTSGATVSGTTTMSASASDNVGVARVDFWVDGTKVTSDTTAPYSTSFATTTVGNGSHTFKAVAFDAAGNSATSSVTATVSNGTDSTPPSVSITSPASGATVSGNVSVAVKTSDNVGVTKTELYVDGTYVSSSTSAPFTTNWNSKGASTGNHTLQVRAYDAAGNSSLSSAVTVYVSGSGKPRRGRK